MAPLPPEHYRLLRAWVEHIVCGYWTHAGYLNWDTGYGFKRWHAGRTWALAQQGLLAIAVSPRFHNAPEIGQWAKYMFDRGLGPLRAALPRGAGREGHRAVEPLRHRTSLRSARASASCSRRACRPTPRAPSRSGSASMGAAEPPPLYSFDADIGRLTITTPQLLDRRAAGQPAARSPTAAWSWPPLRRRPARRVERRRPAVGQLRRAGARPAREGDRHVAAAPIAGAAAPAAHAALVAARAGDGGGAVSDPSLRGTVRDPRRAGPHGVARGRWWTPPTRFTAKPRGDPVGDRPPHARAATRSTCCSRPGARARGSRPCCAAGGA